MSVGRWTFLPLDIGNLDLTNFIRAEIERRGPVSFAWFMEQALYHPQLGYYSSGRCDIGRAGDYFTSVSVGPLFGQLLAAQFAEIWERMGKVDNFTIVEQGAHHGQFARDLLEAIRETSPDFFSVLRYRIVEPFSVLEAQQSETLAELPVDWRASINALEPFVGIHFSNELLDAMPVHLIRSKRGRGLTAAPECVWWEKFVGLTSDGFVFVEQPIIDPKLKTHVQKLPECLVGYETEINLGALDWIGNLSSKLQRGYVVVVDYGFPRDEFYAPHRSSGTLQVRAQHRTLASPFEQIGLADITAYVDWTSLAECAEKHDLIVTGFTDQHHFLTGFISEFAGFAESDNSKTRRNLQTLLHPEMLGRSFQVLALTRDVAAMPALSGFKFARDAQVSLGL